MLIRCRQSCEKLIQLEEGVEKGIVEVRIGQNEKEDRIGDDR